MADAVIEAPKLNDKLNLLKERTRRITVVVAFPPLVKETPLCLPHDKPSASRTIAQRAAWMVATHHTCLERQCLVADPGDHTRREQAFWQMSALVHESLEIIRVLSTTVQDERDALRTWVACLQEQSTAPCARSDCLRVQPIPPGPSAEAIRQAEQPLLDLFKDGLRYAVRGPAARRTCAARAA
jgi:hypothetical protein